MVNNASVRRLGKQAPRIDPRTLKLAEHLNLSLIAAPPQIGWAQPADYGMLGNDQVGDCVFAAEAHHDVVWTNNAQPGSFGGYSAADVLAAYSAVTGWNPTDPTTDRGTVYLDGLNYWRSTGIKGRRIYAYGAVDWKNVPLMHSCIYALGGVQLGLALPAGAEGMTAATGWTVPAQDAVPGSWGGHAVPVVDYTAGWYWCVTWGQLWPLSEAFVALYGDEAYACISQDWLRNPTTPAGAVDLEALGQQLAEVTA